MTVPSYDALIVGAGHNGLVTAAYLARAGLKVKVFEKRDVVGGACVTEEFHPGFKNSTCAYIAGLLSPKVIRDLDLYRHGLEITERTAGMLTLLPEGRHLMIDNGDMAFTRSEIAKFSQKDAAVYETFVEELDMFAALLRDLANDRPPNFGGGLSDILRMLKLGNTFRKLSTEKKERLVCLLAQSVGDYLTSWFESEEVKGAFGYEGIIGSMTSPWSGGSAYVLLHHAFGETNGKPGVWGHARGGMGAITQAMATAAVTAGAEIETNAAVAGILTENGRTTGVRLDSGEEFRARVIAANCTADILFLKLLDASVLPGTFRKRIQNLRYGSGTFRMNVALSELPRFTTLEGRDPARYLNSSINISPSLSYLEQACYDARVRGWARKPVISMNIPSLVDDTLAPEGQHVMSLFCQHFNPRLPDGLDWDNVRDEAVETIIETVNEYAPNFKQAILGYQALSPKDLERDFSLTGGDIFHGALQWDQMFSLRPAAGYADYRTPVGGLYLCGSGAHPGGGVTGLPGHHAALEILKDVRKLKKKTG